MNDLDDEDTWTETTRLTAVNAVDLPLPKVRFVLQQMNGEGAPKRFRIDAPDLTLGRGVEADLQIPSRDLSRLHLRIRCHNDECVIEDLNSSNGCFLNGAKVHSATLRNGDTIQLGRILFSFHEGTL